MILSNKELHRALDDQRLIITPEPSPRMPTLEQDCPYGTHSVDLKLHNEILVPETGKFSIDVIKPGSFFDVISKNSRRCVLTDKQPYHLEAHEFVLARTMEYIELPLTGKRPYLAARIEGKSSRARFGLIVHCTAPTVHPGFKGTLTLEMANLGPVDIVLSPGMYIAQLIIEQVEGEIIANPGQFQGQTDASGKS